MRLLWSSHLAGFSIVRLNIRMGYDVTERGVCVKERRVFERELIKNESMIGSVAMDVGVS